MDAADILNTGSIEVTTKVKQKFFTPCDQSCYIMYFSQDSVQYSPRSDLLPQTANIIKQIAAANKLQSTSAQTQPWRTRH